MWHWKLHSIEILLKSENLRWKKLCTCVWHWSNTWASRQGQQCLQLDNRTLTYSGILQFSMLCFTPHTCSLWFILKQVHTGFESLVFIRPLNEILVKKYTDENILKRIAKLITKFMIRIFYIIFATVSFDGKNDSFSLRSKYLSD